MARPAWRAGPGSDLVANQADLDFVASTAHPAGVGVAGITIDEEMTFARWVDLGCSINTGEGTPDEDFGWFLYGVRPVLTVSAPRPGQNGPPDDVIRVGMADAYSGIAPGTLSITATLALAGRPAGAQLADLAVPTGDGVVIPLSPPIEHAGQARLFAQVVDQQGNVTRVVRTFSVVSQTIFLPFVSR